MKIVKLKCKKYNIIVGKNSFQKLSDYANFKKYSSVVLISEKKIYNLWKTDIDKIIKTKNKILISSGEKMKSLKTSGEICEKLVKFGADRKTLIVNIGGGMITDLGGFSASIYMRGIDYINIPTTLLSMVDASIGGKNGVNLSQTKNIIGCFNDPKLVLIDTNFLTTLPNREFNSAYGEIIKHSIIKSKKYFNILTNQNLLNKKSCDICDIILSSLKIKKYVVEKDFKEKGLRKILNFGHTIGHSIEALSLLTNEPFLHGEAVLLGMFFETNIATNKGILSVNDAKKIYQLLDQYGLKILLNKFKKREKIFTNSAILKIVKKDKKNIGNKIKLSLPVKIGKCNYDIMVQENDIQDCLNFKKNKTN